MSSAASALTPTSNLSPSSSVPCCTPDCALVTDFHLRGKTSRSVALGDIRKTQTSLMAPFHAIMDAASQEAKENRLPRPPSTLGSRSGVSSSVPPSVANTSRISTIDGGKVRPCIILGLYGNIARVCLMGTFGGAFIDDLSPELQEHVSVMFSPTCTRQGNWLQERKIFHTHSTPEWNHVEGKVQYVVPLVLEIGLDAVNKRWAVDGKLAGHSAAGGAEGYYVDMKNMARLRIYANTMSRDLQSQCRDWKYRKNLRYVVEKKPSKRRSTPSVKSAASRPSCASPRRLSVISETGTFSSATETIASMAWGPTDCSSWRSGKSSADICKSYRCQPQSSSRSTTKAGKQDPETSSTHSLMSFVSRKFRSSPLAKNSQSSLSARQN